MRNVEKWLKSLGVPERDRSDVAQTVFEAVIKSLPTYDPLRSPPGRWLNRITLYVASHYRAKAIRWREVLREPARLDVVSANDRTSVHDALVLEERRGVLFEILLRVPANDAWMLVRYHLDEWSMQELAASLQIPLSTAYKWHERALEAARKVAQKLNVSEPFADKTAADKAAHVNGRRQ